MSEQDKVIMALSNLLSEVLRQDRQAAMDAVEDLGLAIDQSRNMPDPEEVDDMLQHVGEGL